MTKTESAFPIYPGWETVRLIGHGSFGTVYEIQRSVLGIREKAALKHMSIPQNQSDVEELYSSGYDDASITAHYESYLADIVREYQMMVEMKGHTNVVNCDDIRYVQKDSGIGWDIYIKMELLTPMTKALDRMIEEKQVVKLGKDLANALVLCQKRNILHRDIKPQNIFVSKDGDFKLGDFGIAKTAEKTSGGTKIGTYNYMAPEVFNNQPYGHEADIYSLGMVLYWLLNERRLPFHPMPPAVPVASDIERARQRRFRGEEIPAPLHGSAELQRVVLKCCAFDPGKRYHSAEDLLWELDALSGRSAAKRGRISGDTGAPEKKVSLIVSTGKKSGTASKSTSFLVRGGGASVAGGGVLLGSLAKKKAAPEPETADFVPPEALVEGTTVDDLEEPAPLIPPTGKPGPEPERTVSAFHEKACRTAPEKPVTRETPVHEPPLYTLDPFEPEENESPTVYGPPFEPERTVGAFHEKAGRSVPRKPLTRENPAHEAPFYTPAPFAKEDEPPTVYDPPPEPENDLTERGWAVTEDVRNPDPKGSGERENVTMQEETPSFTEIKPDSTLYGSAAGERFDRTNHRDSRGAAPAMALIAGILILASLSMIFLSWVWSQVSYLDLIRQCFEAFDTLGFLQAMEESGIALFSLATVLMFVTAVLGIILCLRGKRFAGVPYFASSLLVFGTVLYFCEFTIRYMSFGAWLCVGFALAAMIVMLIPGASSRRILDRGRAAGGETSWLCPRCGAACRAADEFCVSCGMRRRREK